MAALPEYSDRFLTNGDVDIHYVEAGPPSGPLVVLLHGFPSFWYTWKHQIGPLAENGYHVVAPDLRGYNLSSKPSQIAAYGRDPVLSDVSAMISHCGSGADKAVLVGHDWGGNIAWLYAQEHPDRVVKLIILNMPYPASFAAAVRSDIQQMRRSWYIFMFQLPMLGESFLSSSGFEGLKKIIRDDPMKKQDEDHVQRHVAAYSQPGALTATINYYRAIFLYWGGLSTPVSEAKQLTLPVLVLWGENDRALEPRLAEPPRDRVPNYTIIRFPAASHWVMWDEPETVTQHILQFLKGEPPVGSSRL